MQEQTRLPKTLEVGEIYSINVVQQYLEKHGGFYIGASIYNMNGKRVKVVQAMKGQMHHYLKSFTHSSINYREVYEFEVVD